MNEEVIPTPAPSRGRTGPLVVILLIVIAVAAAAIVITKLAGPPADPAALIPKEVAVAAIFDLSKSRDKEAALNYIKGIFADAGLKDPEKKLFEKIDEELGIKVDRDVLPRLNGTGAFAVLTELSGMTPGMVFLLGAKSDGAASGLLDLVSDKLKANKVEFTPVEYEEFRYIRIPMPMGPAAQMTFYVGAVKNTLVGSLGESGFKKVADVAKGKPSLLDENNFVRLRGSTDATFATTYFSGEGYYKLIGPMMQMGMGMMAPDAADTMKEYMENNIAAVGNAEAGARGIKLIIKGLVKKPMPSAPRESIDKLAAMAPRNAAIVFGFNGFDVAWKELKKQLTTSPGFKTQIDQALQQARQTLKMDPFADALDRIESIAGYYVPRPASKPKGFPGSVVFLLDVDKPDVIARSLAKAHGAASSMGAVKFAQASVGGAKITLGPADPQGIRFWDALVGDKVVLGITGTDARASAGDAITAARSRGSTHAASSGFELVKGQLPSRATYFVRGDAAPIVNTFRKDMPPDARKIADAITSKVGAFGMTGSVNGTEYEVQCVLPFRK